jgi:hypothetical protein
VARPVRHCASVAGVSEVRVSTKDGISDSGTSKTWQDPRESTPVLPVSPRSEYQHAVVSATPVRAAPIFGTDTTSMESEIDAAGSMLLSECLLTIQVTFASEMLSLSSDFNSVVGWSWYRWACWYCRSVLLLRYCRTSKHGHTESRQP